MKLTIWLFAVVLLAGTCFGQRCDSISASYSGGWKASSSAPRDGTTVEMLETYGIAPWYGRFKWSKGWREWVNVDQPNTGVSEDGCLFWRPTKKTAKYVDPTNGAQKSVAYWCAAAHLAYDKKTDRCK